MKQYDIITNYCMLECEPSVEIPADLVSSGQEDLDRQNAEIVQSKWKDVWSAAFAQLKEMRKQYEFDADITTESLRAKLMLARADLKKDKEWEVSFTITDDGYGEWGVVFADTSVVTESCQPYF